MVQVLSLSLFKRVAIATLLGLLMLGCSDNAVSQCNRLTAVTNQTVGEVQSIISANSLPDGEALRAVAMSFDRGRDQMGALELSDEQLQDYQTQFIDLYADVSHSALRLADALNEQDFTVAQEARTAFQETTDQELPLVQAVNDYCGAIAPSP